MSNSPTSIPSLVLAACRYSTDLVVNFKLCDNQPWRTAVGVFRHQNIHFYRKSIQNMGQKNCIYLTILFMLLVWLLIFATENIHTLFDFYRGQMLSYWHGFELCSLHSSLLPKYQLKIKTDTNKIMRRDFFFLRSWSIFVSTSLSEMKKELLFLLLKILSKNEIPESGNRKARWQ